MTTPVNFSIAKLLKEKGFNELCNQLYFDGELKDITVQKVSYDDTLSSRYYIAPTIADVVMWLYEKHGIWIDVSLNQFSKPKDLQWMYSIVFTEDCTYSHSPKSYISPTEAYEAAIEYVLTKLIKDVQTNQ